MKPNCINRSNTLAQGGPPPRRQRGISLLLVLVLLVITAASSVYFHNSMVGNTRMSGAHRDNAASLLLAESAMEQLRGSYIAVDCNSPAEGYSQDKCLAYYGMYDAFDSRRQGKEAKDYFFHDTGRLSEFLVDNLPYGFFVRKPGGNGGLTELAPSILQKVANGEAAASPGSEDFSDHWVSTTTSSFAVNDLFTETTRPVLYVPDKDNGLLVVAEGAEDWSALTLETTPEKAAAWLEFTLNPEPDSRYDEELPPNDNRRYTSVDIWVQAVGQVGFAKSYLQRYVGTYYPPRTVGGLAALIEASEIDRRK